MGIQQIPLPAGGVTIGEIDTSVSNNSRGETVWEKIAEYKNSSSVSSHTFSSIPQTYRTLKLVLSAVRLSSGNNSIYVRPNSDSGGNYTMWSEARRDAGAGSTDNRVEITIAAQQWSLALGHNIGSSYSNLELTIPNYTSTDPKFCFGRGVVTNTDGSGSPRSAIYEGYYRSGSTTNAITSLLIGSNSTFYYENTWNPSFAILYGGK